MKARQFRTALALWLRSSLENGDPVRIEGLGTFRPDKGGRPGFRFEAQTKPRVFIAYVEEDLQSAQRLYRRFRASGLDPWLDKKKLLPGQNWPRAIEAAIQMSDYFVPCFSPRSVSKRGSFHCELRFAIECAKRVPLDEIYLLPVRLDECVVPGRIARHVQYVDLFPDWDTGIARLLETIAAQEHQKREKKTGPKAA